MNIPLYITLLITLTILEFAGRQFSLLSERENQSNDSMECDLDIENENVSTLVGKNTPCKRNCRKSCAFPRVVRHGQVLSFLFDSDACLFAKIMVCT